MRQVRGARSPPLPLPVAELDRDDAIALSKALHAPDTDGQLTRRLPQETMQVGPTQRQAPPDGGPQLGDVDLAQRPAVVVVEALPRDLDGPGGDLRLQPEGAEGAGGVAGQIDTGTRRSPRRFALDHLDRDSDVRERGCQR
jgi:hypothetical protein